MSQYTEYAHLYLSGFNNIPIGVLDNAEFKSEVARLSGYTEPSLSDKLKHNARMDKVLTKIDKMIKPLLGPKGGKPIKGESLREYNNLIYNRKMILSGYWSV